MPTSRKRKNEDYFNHPAVKFLANNNVVELTVMHRCDVELWNILEDVDKITHKFDGKCCDKNVCYLNRTRKYVHNIVMNRLKPENALLIKATETDELTQKIYIFEGMPIIGRKTIKGGEEMVNNEEYTIKKINNDDVICTAIRNFHEF
jgi:hypothetical protein